MFALRDLKKDLHLALNLFHRVEAHVPLTALVREWVDEAAEQDGSLDISAVIRRYTQCPGFGRQNRSDPLFVPHG
jgi:3-hydroxyisobutyrate dehydrogenase-like beta-hydroxyacid dehydrogenase